MSVTTEAELRASLSSIPSDYSSSDYIFFDGEVYSKLTNIKSDKIVVDKAKIASIESETSYYITGEEVYKYFLQIQDFIELTKDKVFVIETWSDGTEWYRKWSDGWVEQGGYFNCSSSGTILTFHQSFSDTNYYLNGNGSQITAGVRYVSFYNRTSTTAACYTAGGTSFNSAYVYWYACGY